MDTQINVPAPKKSLMYEYTNLLAKIQELEGLRTFSDVLVAKMTRSTIPETKEIMGKPGISGVSPQRDIIELFGDANSKIWELTNEIYKNIGTVVDMIE